MSVFKNDDVYIWSIFGKCYLLEKHDDKIKIYELSIKLIRDNSGRIERIKLSYSILPESSIDNQNLIKTINSFKKGEIR